jgi:Dolichyl-phosphate-mannose-protein mannosyltransferase
VTSPADSIVRRVLRAVMLTIGVLGSAWSALLLWSGGFELVLFGTAVTTHAPLRPLLIASVAFVVFILSGGVLRLPDRAIRAMGTLAAAAAPVCAWARPYHGAWALAALVVAVGVGRGSAVAGGADSYGYVSEAQLWAHGQLYQPMPLISEVPWPIADLGLAPLGYRPSLNRDGIVPGYAPGLPMIMALAQTVAGYCAIRWVVPLFGGVLMLATFALGARLATPLRGLAAALLVAVSPAFVYMLMNPMSDVPVAAAWAVSFVLLMRPSARAAFGAGLVCAVAILIRPNLLPSVIAPIGYLAWQWFTRGSSDRRGAVTRLVVFGVGVVPGVALPLWINWHLFGSPLKSGYGTLDTLFALDHILPNVRHYLWWVTESQTPVMLLGLLPLFVPLRRFWPAVGDRSVIAMLTLFVFTVWAQYCYYADFDAWWYLRFLLPAWPFLMLGVAQVACAVLPGGGRAAPALLALGFAAVVVFCVNEDLNRSVFRLWEGEQRYLTVAAEVRAATGRQSVVFSMQHSGSLRYYAGRTTIRYDNFEPAWLDRSIAWLTERGIRTYLLVEDWEIDVFKQRFAGQQTMTRLDAPPLFVYDGPFTIYFFDLGSDASRGTPVRVVTETYKGPFCVPPVLPPSLVVSR